MIIVEERLRDLFLSLPKISVGQKDYAVNFDFGSHKDLLRFMNSERKLKGGVQYPIIWLETPIERVNFRNNDITLNGMTLILATLSNSEQSNLQRLETTFKPTLNPLYDNVIKALKYSGFTQIIGNQEVKQTNFYNYGVDESEHLTTDVWDVIKIELDLIMNGKCSQCINY